MTRTRKLLLVVTIFAAVIVTAAALHVASFRPATGPPPRAGELGYPWRGVFHVHSTASDGAGDIDQIMAAAVQAGVDFVVLSDHNPTAAERPRSAWYGDVLLIVAEEISTEAGHLLALQVKPHRYRFGRSPRQAVRDIEDEGGWALLAHADHAWQPWRDGWSGVVGLEVVNLAAAWSRQAGLSRLATIATSFIDPDAAAVRLLRYRWPMLAAWDERTALTAAGVALTRPRTAIGAADAHGPFVGPVPSYADTLGAVATLVWIDQSPEQARATAGVPATERQLLQAVRDGRAAVEVTALGDARTFSFAAQSAGVRVPMGAIADFEDGLWRLRAAFDAGAPAEMVLLRDGVEVARTAAGSLEAPVERPGTYRIAVYRADLGAQTVADVGPPWLISNPIYVWPTASRVAARVRRVPPLPAPPVSRDLLAEASFDDNERGVVDNRVRLRETARWRFELQRDGPEDAFAAAVWLPEEPLDWSRADGLVVDARSRWPLRFDLELRVAGPAGATESWVYSVKATPDSEPTAIPWNRFREPWSPDLSDEENADPRRPTSVELSRVQGVVLVVTPLLLEAGARGNVELRVLGLYGER